MADNMKMWKELGMDVEHHDELCSVLPAAVGDVFMSQENRPEKWTTLTLSWRMFTGKTG